jgi:ABC-type dipeptide/oligopeptide/nickel transport system ATPase component
MSRLIGIVGPSGSGKSTALRNLDPKSTYVINVLGKDLPFKNSGKMYNANSKNYFASESYSEIIGILKAISEKREDIKTIVIDDIGFLMQTEFFNRASEKGYDKFSEIGQHMFQVLNTAKSLRNDINVVCLYHTEDVYSGQVIVGKRIKTIGEILPSINLFNCWDLPMGQSAAKPVREGSTTSGNTYIN